MTLTRPADLCPPATQPRSPRRSRANLTRRESGDASRREARLPFAGAVARIEQVGAAAGLEEDIGLSLAADGRRVVFHCMGGLGRAGTAACCCLVHAGVDARTALEHVRAARKGAVETATQERFIQSYTAADGG